MASRGAAPNLGGRLFYEEAPIRRDVDKPRPRRGWALGVVLDVSLIVLPVPLVVMVPPIVDCRFIETNVGFYADESFRSCALDGISERWALLDSRIKMLVRQSGR